MSPSRIPRPQGGAPPSPLGPNAEQYRLNTSTASNGSPKTIHAGAFHHGSPHAHHTGAPGISSAASAPGFKPNSSFIQPRSPQLSQSTQAALSPPSNPSARLPQSRSRRPKPPPEDDSGSGLGDPQYTHAPGTSQSTPSSRRQQGPGTASPERSNSGIPRPSRGVGSPTVGAGPGNGPTPGNRTCLRQPSVPALSAHRDREVVKPRTRATSAAADTRPPSDEPKPPVPLFAPSFAESREPSVPPHIRIRLRLIHQLGVVLGIDAQGISSKIDVPGLLARVDAAYDRGYQGAGLRRGGDRGTGSTAMSSGASGSSISGLPMPNKGGIEGPTEMSGKKGEKDRDRDRDRGMFGMFKRFGKDKAVSKDEERVPFAFSSQAPEGPAFAVSLNDAPAGSWCTSLIGGQKHELPLVVFTIVEEIYRRGKQHLFSASVKSLTSGMSQPGIFRLAGDGTRISHLTKVFNLPPLYGDFLSLANEPIHNLTGLVKRYIRDLPEPILDESLFPAFLSFCAEPEPGALVLPLPTRIAAAQILLKLLPPLHFSLLIYLLAFLGQLPLFPDNRLNVESISIIFGPAICAARGKGISGLGMGASGGKLSHDPDVVSNLVNQSQATLGWLLRNWAAISEKVLDPPFEDDEADVTRANDRTENSAFADPRLLSPIDLRTATGDAQNPFTRPRSQSQSNTSRGAQNKPVPLDLELDKRDQAKSDEGKSLTRSATISPSPSSGSGIFARAFSSMNIAAQAKGGDEEKVPKRSASFNSLSSLVKKGGAFIRNDREPKSAGMTSPKVNPQITNVLGSLHDLLVSKDKQIERDARELALLRHTLLEMDEKLQRATSSCPPSPLPPAAAATPLSPCSCGSPASDTVGTPPTPAITITSTPSTTTLLAKEKEIADMQTQLTTALAALETARLQSRKQAEKTLDLEAKLARADSEKRLETGKLEVALALEQAKAATLVEERDVARDRLEKIKTTLFAVA